MRTLATYWVVLWLGIALGAWLMRPYVPPKTTEGPRRREP